MKDVYRITHYGVFELEWIKLHKDMKQTNVRFYGDLVRTFLSTEAAKKWIDEIKVLKC